MARRFVPIVLLLLVVSVFAAPLHEAEASEATRVQTAADDVLDIPYSFRIAPSFEQRFESGVVSRETDCADPDNTACPDFSPELDYRRIINSLNVDIAMGLYRDLELNIRLPIVLSDQRRLQYADGVNSSNTTIDSPEAGSFRSDNPDNPDYYRFNYHFFHVGAENRGPRRAGFGDMTVGLAWKPFNQLKQPHLGNLVLSFDYTAPTGRTARADNTGVGRGVHELAFGVRAGRRFRHFDPYMGVDYRLPLPASDTLFDDLGGSRQRFRTPGMAGSVLLGTEIILFEDKDSEQHYTFNVSGRFEYVAEGRDYNPLFEGLSSSRCNGTRLSEVGTYGNRYDGSHFPANRDAIIDGSECGWIVQQPSNETDGRFRHDGITLVDAHRTLEIETGFNLAFSRYVQMRIFASFETQSAHFLTGERTGQSTSEDGRVDLDPDAGERNPYYNPTLDAVGSRFRLQSIFNWSWGTQFAFRF